MKRLRSSDDLDSYGGEKNVGKEASLNRTSSSSHRSFYYKPESVRKGFSSSTGRYDRDRSVDDEREGSRLMRKRSEHDFEGFDRRKGFNRFRDGSVSGGESRGYGGGNSGGGSGSCGDRNAIHRSESFSGSRREFPKGFRSERDRSRREGSVSSWRKFGSVNKDFDEGLKSRNGGGLDERGSAKSSPRGLREVKSPTWSKDSGSEKSKLRASPTPITRGFRDEKSISKSPTWSKDSGSEQSKSVDVKKSDELQNGSRSRSSSEMEEGELEPEPEPEVEAETNVEAEAEVEVEVEAEAGIVAEADIEAEAGIGAEPDIEAEAGIGAEADIEAEAVIGAEADIEPEVRMESEAGPRSVSVSDTEGKVHEFSQFDNHEMGVESGNQAEDMDAEMGDKAELLDGGEMHLNEKIISNGDDAARDGVELLNCQNNLSDAKSGMKYESGVVADDDRDEKELLKKGGDFHVQSTEDMRVEKAQSEVELKPVKHINLVVKAEDFEASELNKEVTIEKVASEAEASIAWESLVRNLKDKGKQVAVDSSEYSVCVGSESRDVDINLDNDMEGPSIRGFELFRSSPVRRKEKTDQHGDSNFKKGNLAFEPLDLSLSLPNVLLPIGASGDFAPAPGSPGPARSVQSLTNTFCSNSDGFTASMSFSGSQSFFHNPSCSLTHNSMDNYEQSVGSRPIFQGIDQASQGVLQGQSQNESKHKDVPLYQRILMNGSGSHGNPNGGQSMQGHHPFREGSSKISNGLEKQLSFNRQFSEQLKYNDDVRSSTQSAGSYDNGSTYSFEKKRVMKEKSSGSLYRTSSLKEQEKLVTGGADFVDTVIARLISEPVHEMAKKFNEMTGQSIACVKESIREIMSNADRQRQVYAFQKTLQNRFDITMDLLLKSHRAQLEILVALKTGLPDYLKHNSNIATSDLVEIFLNLRCRNLTCKNLLPVDECDCKVCAQKNGFCSACMCLVCSKFDTASNTCSWVGCDVCLHWCHADCGLRKSYIRNGSIPSGPHGTTEMQFHCVACDHPSEMFGFVKEVFQSFAKEWSAETFSSELEYVKRIFSASKDIRGKQLHELTDQLLVRLANKSNLPEVYSQIMSFFTNGDSSKFGKTPISSTSEQAKGTVGISGPSKETPWMMVPYSEKAPQFDRAISRHPSFNYDRNDKSVMESESKKNSQREPIFDELDSIVRIKLTEAKMFQVRADEARQEAEGLKRIALTKNEKIEEEYSSRIAKLRIYEAEEMRKQKLEELQALERAHREYSSMKARMEADIKDLLLKMEATKRNFAA